MNGVANLAPGQMVEHVLRGPLAGGHRIGERRNPDQVIVGKMNRPDRVAQ